MAKKKAKDSPKQPATAPPKAPPQAPAAEPGPARFPIVGIGASAGGVEAVREFFSAMKSGSGIAFAIIPHLDPEHKSAFPEILRNVTRMPVTEAREGERVEPNHVYVLPSSSDMVIREGQLRLVPRPAGQLHLPIDTFLAALAEERQDQAVGVILSGSGSDGTRGLQAIKGYGGITFAQDQSAGYASMPRSAVQAGVVDFVLPAAGIAAELIQLSKKGFLQHGAEEPPSASAPQDDELLAVIRRLADVTGIDFNHYKQSTLRRRIERRMLARKMSSLREYLDCLYRETPEVQQLFDEAIIPVTAFFRDPAAFDALGRVVFPHLLERRPANAPIRVWVPGCSTGEEIYSLAISLTEFLYDRNDNISVKLFGTDINEKALATARSGVYPESIADDVSPARLRRYFVKRDGTYQVNKQTRDLCVFARQDITHDPPFSQLDLLSCRNVLIYFDTILQKRVLPVFHYALKPSGYLFLGVSETVGACTDLFDVLDKKHKIFARSAKQSRLTFEYAPGQQPHLKREAEALEEDGRGAPEIQREADRQVLARYAPPGVVVDEQLQIVQFRGHTGACLEPAAGAPTANLLQMVREGLLVSLRETLERARKHNLPARTEKVKVKTNHHFQDFNLEVLPITLPAGKQRFFVILFEDAGSAPAATATRRGPRQPAAGATETETERGRNLARIQQELQNTRGYLQSVIEDKEAANEELKAANEEIVSSNEELQSTNEELETAKEELQATNEELTTVNDELQNRIAIAAQLSDDLNNLIDSVGIPTIVLGNDLRLRRVTPSAQRLLNLLPADLGRPISDFKLKLDLPNLEALIQEMFSTVAIKQVEVTDKDGVWYRVTIQPYRRDLLQIDGAVITLVDIDIQKRRERQIEEASAFAYSTLNIIPMPLVILNSKLQVHYANPGFHHLFQTTLEQVHNQSIFGLLGTQWNLNRLHGLLEKVLPQHQEFSNIEVRQFFPSVGERTLLVNARHLKHPGDESVLILLTIQDITERKKLEKQMLDVVDQEQRRIGQELHDSVGQELTGLAMLADAAAQRMQQNSVKEVDSMFKVRDGLTSVHQHIRMLSRGLAPLEPDVQGLRAALEELAKRTGEQSGVICRCDCAPDIAVKDPTTSTHLYRIAQEAISNALRHGKPREILVTLKQTDGHLSLTIRDDGTGMPTEPTDHPTFGIQIMHYRAGLIGGTLNIGAADGKGTLVACTVPREQ